MGFLSGALGTNSSFQAKSATGDAKFQQQKNLPGVIGDTQGTYGNVNNNQSALANQLIAQSQGVGPNIADMQLQQATENNVAQGAGAIAGQRGINPALAARLVAQQTAGANQQEAGQSALLRAQQQQNAQSGAASIYGQQAGEANSNLGINQAALANQNSQIVSANDSANQINSDTAKANAASNSAMIGGLLQGAGAVASMGGTKAAAGAAKGLYTGGQVGPGSLKGGPVPGKAAVAGNSPKNDTVPAMLSPEEIVLPRSVTMAPDSPQKAKEFIEAIKAQEQEKSGPTGYAKVLEAKRKIAVAHGHLLKAKKALS